jgi:hypothetical protein
MKNRLAVFSEMKTGCTELLIVYWPRTLQKDQQSLPLPPSENISGVPFINLSVSENISDFHTDVKSNSVIV